MVPSLSEETRKDGASSREERSTEKRWLEQCCASPSGYTHRGVEEVRTVRGTDDEDVLLAPTCDRQQEPPGTQGESGSYRSTDQPCIGTVS